MNNKKCFPGIVVCAAVALLLATPIHAQSNNRKEMLRRFLESSDKLSENQKAFLSSGMRHFLRHAEQANSGELDVMEEDVVTMEPLLHAQIIAQAATTRADTVRVSNPDLDFANSVLGGFSQSTTSSGRCGNTVVVGYHDTGAQLRSRPRYQSYDGVAASGDGGLTFTDLGFLNPGTDSSAVLAGDPVVACSSASQFYYASLYETSRFDNGECASGCPLSGISVSTSTNGGRGWANPIIAILQDGFGHVIDKPWLAVDPTNPLHLYITLTDFALSGCTSIDIVSSKDSGKTWGAPVVIDQECGVSGNIVTGSNVVVSPSGKVHVAYELIPAAPNAIRQIVYQRSLDHGQTFSAALKVSGVVPIGDGGANNFMQAKFQAREFPQIAVDRTNEPSRGFLYIAWPDGRGHVKPDSFSGTYAYADILVAKSTDIGLSFSVLPPISPTPVGFGGRGRDQFAPGVAVNRNGEVAVCYYDRRNDPRNTAIDRYCSVSMNHGAAWQDLRASSPSWVPLAADVLPDKSGAFLPVFNLGGGEYDSLTSDFLLINSGFFGAFQIQTDGNPNVIAKQF